MVYAGRCHSGLFIADHVKFRETEIRILRIGYQICFRINAIPPVQDMKSQEASRHDCIQFQWTAHIVVSFDQDHSCGSAIKPPPVHPQEQFLPDLRPPLQAGHLL